MSSSSRLILPDGGVIDLFDSCTFGRDSGNTVKLPDNHTSKFHAIVQPQGDGGCWLVDLGSSNGTHLNGRRLSRPHLLRHGDQIQIGVNMILFETELDPEVTATGSRTGSGGGTEIFKVVRPIWLLVADITGSTKMVCDHSPEQVARITGEWFRNCRNLLDGREAHMNQYLGDGFLCYWEDTLDIRFQIIAAMRELAKMQDSTPPAFRFILHYGKTLLSGIPTLSSLTLHGDSVHFAFRMEKIAGKLKLPILCSEAAITRLKLGSLARHESDAEGFNGQFPFFVPDLDS